MKLLMKADDGKEIIYFSQDMYEIVKTEADLDGYAIELHSIEQTTKEYFDALFSNLDKKWNIFDKEGKLVISTTDYYFTFDQDIKNIIKNYAQGDEKPINLFLGYPDDEFKEYWNYALIGGVK